MFVLFPFIITARKFFPVTFVGSILWIAAFSYLMVWWATVTGETFGIPPEVRCHVYIISYFKARRAGFCYLYTNIWYLLLGHGIDLFSCWNINSRFDHECNCSEKRVRRYGSLLVGGLQYIWCNSWVRLQPNIQYHYHILLQYLNILNMW